MPLQKPSQYLLTGGSTAVVTDKAPKALFKKSGVSLTIKKDGEEIASFNAFLQPLRYKNKLYLSGVPTELGYDGLKKYLLICPPDIDLEMVTEPCPERTSNLSIRSSAYVRTASKRINPFLWN